MPAAPIRTLVPAAAAFSASAAVFVWAYGEPRGNPDRKANLEAAEDVEGTLELRKV